MTEQVPQYKPIAVTDTMVRDGASGLVQGKRVEIRLADGTHTFIEVPMSPHWPDVARQKIEELVTQHEHLMGLMGPMVDIPPNPRTRT